MRRSPAAASARQGRSTTPATDAAQSETVEQIEAPSRDSDPLGLYVGSGTAAPPATPPEDNGVSGTGGGPLNGAVQRCGPTPCDCSAEERAQYALTHQGEEPEPPAPAVQRSSLQAPVQRLELPSGLLDRIRSLISGVTSIFSSGESDANSADREATTEGDRAAVDAETDTEREETEGEGEAEEASEEVSSETDGLTNEGEEAGEEGERERSAISALGPMVPDVVTPGGATGGTPAAPVAGAPEAGRARNEMANRARQEDANVELTCDGIKVLEGLGRGVKALYNRVKQQVKQAIAERLAQLRQFAGDLGAGILRRGAAVADAVANGIERVSAALGRVVDRVTDTMRQLIDRLRATVDRIVAGVRAALEAIGTRARQVWDRVKAGARRAFDRAVSFIRERAGGVASRARNLAGRLWRLVPSPIRSRAEGVASRVQSFGQRLREKAEALAARLREKWERLKERIRNGIERLKERALALWEGIKRTVDAAIEKLRELKDRVVEGLRNAADSLRSTADDLVERTRARIQQNREQRERELRGEICAPLGAAVTPCVEDILPDLGPGTENSMKFYVKGDLSIPLKYFNLKLAGESSVTIKRAGNKFSVTLAGQGTLAANVSQSTSEGGPGGVSVDVTTPQGSSSLLDAMKALAGGGSLPDSKASGTLEAGKRGTLQGTFDFDKTGDDDTCDGLGGMVTFLGGLGAAGVLPRPFSAMAGHGTLAGFADKASSLSFRVASYGTAAGEASAAGLVDLKGSAGVEQFIEINLKELNQDGEEGPKLSATVGQKMSASGETGVSIPQIVRLARAGLAGEQSISLTLTLALGSLELKASQLKLEGKLTATASKAVLQAVAAVLPSDAGTWLRARMDELGRADLPYIGAGGMFGLEVTLSATVEGAEQILVNLVNEIRDYLEGAGASATSSGVMDIVARVLRGVTLHTCITVKTIESDVYSMKVGAKAKGGGASVEAGLEHTRSRQLVQAGTSTTVTPGTPGTAEIPGTPGQPAVPGTPGTPALSRTLGIPRIWPYPSGKHIVPGGSDNDGAQEAADLIAAAHAESPDSTFHVVTVGHASRRWFSEAHNPTQADSNNAALAERRGRHAVGPVREAITGRSLSANVTAGTPQATRRAEEAGTDRKDNSPEFRRTDVVVGEHRPGTPGAPGTPEIPGVPAVPATPATPAEIRTEQKESCS